MKIDYTLEHIRRNMWTFVVHRTQPQLEEKLEGKVISVLDYDVKFEGMHRPKITITNNVICISIGRKREQDDSDSSCCIFRATKHEVHIIHNTLEWINVQENNDSSIVGIDFAEPNYYAVKEAAENLIELKEKIQKKLEELEIPRKMINAQHMLEYKMELVDILLTNLPIYSRTCPYCIHKYKTGTSCNDCSFAKKHGACNSESSDWGKMFYHLKSMSDLLEKLHG